MFINKRNVTRHVKDSGGQVIQSKTKVLYLFDGQGVNTQTEHPETQKRYKAIYDAQTKASIEKSRPVSAFEVIGLFDGIDLF